MLSYVIGFFGVALFPAALAGIGGHLATLAITDHRARTKVLALVWVLAGLGVMFAGLQQVLAYRSDRENSSKVSELQSTTTGLRGTLDTSLQQQQYMKGQLESISVMIGKVGEKSADQGMRDLASALSKIAGPVNSFV